MFKKDGWVSLQEMSQVTYALECGIHEQPLQSDFTDQILFWNARALFHYEVAIAHPKKLWEYLDGVSRAVVLCGTADPIDASLDLFDYDDPWSSNGTYVNLTVGTVGSAARALPEISADVVMSSEAELDAIHTSNMQRQFGPFLHCPILVGDQEFAEFCKSEWQVERTKKPYIRSSEYAAQIVAAKREDPKRSRAWFKKYVCPELKADEFRAVLREARLIEPLVSRPGRASR